MPETSDVLHEVDGDNTSMFAKILGAIKEADKIMENKITSVVKVILFNTKLCNRKIYKVIWKKIVAYVHTGTDKHDIPLNQNLFLPNAACLD